MNRKDTDRHARAKRAAALARPEIGQLPKFTYTNDRMPDTNRICIGFAADEHGIYRLPFPIKWTGDKWLNANPNIPLDVTIVGWL
jgi:hypothetical protein